jgi:hypothetical protein
MQPKISALSLAAAASIVVLIAFALLWGLRPAHVGPSQASAPPSRVVSPQSAAIALPAPNFKEAKRSGGASPGNAEVGLAENSWDFTAPDGVPGFGTLDSVETQRLLQLIDQSPKR